MIGSADIDIESVIPLFNEKGVDFCFLVPTCTGMDKSIMDATSSVRDFLCRNGIHDYNKQGQGQEHKVTYPTFYVTHTGLTKTSSSLYRPNTKNGDPRIWFSNLKRYCNPNNLLGIVSNGKVLFILNLSNPNLIHSFTRGGVAEKLLLDISEISNATSIELLGKLRSIHNKGYIATLRAGDTGVGKTLESLLGIQDNTDKTPDYKGIEIKASRKRQGTPNRVNLFCQVPDWKNSNLKSGREILNQYGYSIGDDKQLYVTVNAKPNAQGLFLTVDEYKDILFNKQNNNGILVDVVLWQLKMLRNRLTEKHPETFWVKATSEGSGDTEKFRYDSIVHTRKPNTHLLNELLVRSIVTMDYTLSERYNHEKQTKKFRDHGYIFKINPHNIPLLFPDPINHNLSLIAD